MWVHSVLSNYIHYYRDKKNPVILYFEGDLTTLVFQPPTQCYWVFCFDGCSKSVFTQYATNTASVADGQIAQPYVQKMPSILCTRLLDTAMLLLFT
jgi:hypothetical protein